MYMKFHVLVNLHQFHVDPVSSLSQSMMIDDNITILITSLVMSKLTLLLHWMYPTGSPRLVFVIYQVDSHV